MNPFLPKINLSVGPGHTIALREEGGHRFHQACLELSHFYWIDGKPAQAILQLNKASMVAASPAPFKALCWYLENLPKDRFVGNPVRHFQHLASRISGVNTEMRRWRAWASFHLAETILPSADFPRDAKQIQNEGLVIPTISETLKKLPAIDSSSLPDLFLLGNVASVSAHSSTG